KTDAKDAANTKAKDKIPAVAKADAREANSAKDLGSLPKPDVKDAPKASDAAPVVAQSDAKDAKAKDNSPQVARPAPPSRDTDAARQLLKQGRQALKDSKFAEAEKLAKQAKDKNPDLNWWDDTPEKLIADIRRASPAVAQATAAADK